MIYQIDYISHSYWDANCTIAGENISLNDAEWLGLQKLKNIPDSNLPSLLQGYIGEILKGFCIICEMKEIIRLVDFFNRDNSGIDVTSRSSD